MTITNPFEKLVECHDHIMSRLSLFDQTLTAIEQQRALGFRSEKDNIKMMFDFIDTSIALHTRDEEEGLFPKLRPKLEEGLPSKHGGGTPVDVMEEEHRTVEGVIDRLKDIALLMEKETQPSEVADLVNEFVGKGRWLVQAYYGHIWKENNVLFPMAERMLSADEKTEVAKAMNELRQKPGVQ
jgi:regulator of cell morphogenesis and NO signaling